MERRTTGCIRVRRKPFGCCAENFNGEHVCRAEQSLVLRQRTHPTVGHAEGGQRLAIITPWAGMRIKPKRGSSDE